MVIFIMLPKVELEKAMLYDLRGRQKAMFSAWEWPFGTPSLSGYLTYIYK